MVVIVVLGIQTIQYFVRFHYFDISKLMFTEKYTNALHLMDTMNDEKNAMKQINAKQAANYDHNKPRHLVVAFLSKYKQIV